ncbi:hypothetical protein [Catenuloplanes indicus]|uniref:Uncharacterized protein n=1 Tax=Catenuloplanes indicus TaxID=137267 RepID=A0AAE3W534_9ACTN|nr:hypothetical protein [Catenuloplanes indicus]MDQ0370093.1 hypothetical protein [Catenuloplanes indicus]
MTVYGRKWNFRRHEPVYPISASAAAARDARGDHYAVALPGPDRPAAVLEIAWRQDHAGVWFLDDRGRQTLLYEFRRIGDRLFLHSVTEWDYGGNDSAVRVCERRFREDGQVRRIVTDDDAPEHVTEDRWEADVAAHWEPVPRFGEWASLARRDRG